MAVPTDTSTPAVASLADQNTILFGSLNEQVADEFCDLIDSALAEGVASLPLMGTAITTKDEEGGDSREERMMKKLRKAYYRNVDLFELYAGRNIFSVAARTQRVRQRVVEAFIQTKQTTYDDGNKTAPEDVTPNDSNSTGYVAPRERVSMSFAYPQNDDIPSVESVQSLKQELKDLRLKLKEARSARNARVHVSKRLVDIEKFTTEAKHVLLSQPIDRVQREMEALVQGRAALEALQTQGKEASQKMDEGKRKRDENEQQQNEENILRVEPKTKKILTLEEYYQEDRKILQESEAEGLVKLKGLLQRKN